MKGVGTTLELKDQTQWTYRQDLIKSAMQGYISADAQGSMCTALVTTLAIHQADSIIKAQEAGQQTTVPYKYAVFECIGVDEEYKQYSAWLTLDSAVNFIHKVKPLRGGRLVILHEILLEEETDANN